MRTGWVGGGSARAGVVDSGAIEARRGNGVEMTSTDASEARMGRLGRGSGNIAVALDARRAKAAFGAAGGNDAREELELVDWREPGALVDASEKQGARAAIARIALRGER